MQINPESLVLYSFLDFSTQYPKSRSEHTYFTSLFAH